MPRVQQIPFFVGSFFDGDRPRVAAASTDPATPMAALMECSPFEDPRTSALERVASDESIADSVDALNERERYVVDSLYWRQLTLRDLGAELSLSKTQVARVRDAALSKLRVALTEGAS